MSNPLIAPPIGKGYHRWLQTTRKAYIIHQKMMGKKVLQAKVPNNKTPPPKIPFPINVNGNQVFNFTPKRSKFVNRFRKGVYINPLLY